MLKFLYEVSTMSEGGKRKKKGGKGKKNGKKKAPDALTYASLLQSMRNELNNLGYHQAPVLTASRPVSVKDEFKIVPDNFSGQRKALIIAINYAPDTPFYIPYTSLIRLYSIIPRGIRDGDLRNRRDALNGSGF